MTRHLETLRKLKDNLLAREEEKARHREYKEKKKALGPRPTKLEVRACPVCGCPLCGCACVSVCACMYVCDCVCVCVCVCACVYACLCAHVGVCLEAFVWLLNLGAASLTVNVCSTALLSLTRSSRIS